LNFYKRWTVVESLGMRVVEVYYTLWLWSTLVCKKSTWGHDFKLQRNLGNKITVVTFEKLVTIKQ
jgi:hypothetical protein